MKVKLHYLTSTTTPSPSPVSSNANANTKANPQALIVFLHGFPDSAHLFAPLLTGALSRSARLVALDLPGYGGSGGLGRCGTEVLSVVAEAILLLKGEILWDGNGVGGGDGKGRCVLVGHDWGGCIAYRLAAEAPGLVDRAVVLNSVFVPHASSRLRHHLSGARASWSAALAAYGLVLSQLLKSYYIFTFNLPWPFANFGATLISKFQDRMHELAYRSKVPLPVAVGARAAAVSAGPGVEECTTVTGEGERYGLSVLERARQGGGWEEKVRLYREGLATGAWDRPRFDSDLGVPNDDGGDRLQTPVVVLFGLQDLALDPRICLDGIEEFFAAGEKTASIPRSYVVRVPEGGHWLMLEEKGREAVEGVLDWCVREGRGGEVVVRLEEQLGELREAGVVQVQ